MAGSTEQPARQEHEWRQNAQQLAGEQVDRDPRPRPAIRDTPIRHSSTAVTMSPTAPGTSPNDITEIVVSTRPCAGLRPGTNLSTPKPRKSTPMLTRSAVMLKRINQLWTMPSSRMSLAFVL